VGNAVGYMMSGRSLIPGRQQDTVACYTASIPELRPMQFLSRKKKEVRPFAVERPGRDIDHSSPSSVNIKNIGTVYPPPPTPLRRHGVALV
jgi:hypothetical protein